MGILVQKVAIAIAYHSANILRMQQYQPFFFKFIKEKSKGLGFGFYAPLEFCQSEIAMTLRPNLQVSPDQRTGSNLGRKQLAERWPVFSKVPRLFTNTHGLLTIPPQLGTVPAIRKGVSESWGKG